MSASKHAAAEAVAAKLLTLAVDSGTAAHFTEVYGAGVIYRAFTKHQHLQEFATAPAIDDKTTYLAGERTSMCGELAVGAIALGRADNVIVVIDDIEQSSRTTLARFGSLGGRPLTIEMELVPCEIVVESLPEPLDEARRADISQRVRAAALAHRASVGTVDRALYFIDVYATPDADEEASTDDVVQRVALADFEQLLANMLAGDDDDDDDPTEIPASMEQLATLARTHDPQREAVVWLRHSDVAHDAWTVALDE